MKRTIIKDNLNKYLINKIDPDENNVTYSVANNSTSVIIQNLSGFTDINIGFEITGKGSSVLFFGFFIGYGKRKISVETRQHHLVGGSSSRVFVRSVLFGGSSISYKGTIRVEKEASGTDAFEQNDNLLLGYEAKAYSKPVLEILSGDLHCTHSVSISYIRPEELWFLENRGIDRQRGEGMIAAGFLTDVMAKIPKPEKATKIISEIPSLLGISYKKEDYESA